MTLEPIMPPRIIARYCETHYDVCLLTPTGAHRLYYRGNDPRSLMGIVPTKQGIPVTLLKRYATTSVRVEAKCMGLLPGYVIYSPNLPLR